MSCCLCVVVFCRLRGVVCPVLGQLCRVRDPGSSALGGICTKGSWEILSEFDHSPAKATTTRTHTRTHTHRHTYTNTNIHSANTPFNQHALKTRMHFLKPNDTLHAAARHSLRARALVHITRVDNALAKIPNKNKVPCACLVVWVIATTNPHTRARAQTHTPHTRKQRRNRQTRADRQTDTQPTGGQ